MEFVRLSNQAYTSERDLGRTCHTSVNDDRAAERPFLSRLCRYPITRHQTAYMG